MSNAAADVERYLTDLQHPLKQGVLSLRTTILAADPALTEHIKWNAPSFRYAGEDRVTFRLQPRGLLQLIFHRGAKARPDTATFTFDDPSGLLNWLTPDRAVLDFPDLAAVTTHQAEVSALVARWIRT